MRKTSILFALISSVLFFSCSEDKMRIAYVDNVRIYNEFNLTKELSGKLNETLTKKKKLIDSLELQLNSLALDIESSNKNDKEKRSRFDILKGHYFQKLDEFEQENETLSSQFNTQITSRINELVNMYGSENDFDVILGANGQGSIMFAKEALDITDRVILFINEKYEGKLN